MRDNAQKFIFDPIGLLRLVVQPSIVKRYGRSMRAAGEGLRRAFAAGITREQVYVVAKGGFLRFADGPPADLDAWFETNVARKGLGTRDDLAGVHCLAPGYIAQQIDEVREAMGLATLDAFLIDQPETVAQSVKLSQALGSNSAALPTTRRARR